MAVIHYFRDCQELLIYNEKGEGKRGFKATERAVVP